MPDLLDLTGVQMVHMPHILTDLRRVQRPVSRTPVFLVHRLDLVTQRLIASSDIPGVLCSADALVAHLLPHLTDLLHQPHAIGTNRPWIGLMPPAAAQVIAPETIPLLAALTCVTSQSAAGDLCGVSRSTVQRLLLELQTTLDLPPARHRCPYEWVSLVLDMLAQEDLCPASQG